ncbi:MAG: cytidylate kinase-like family protein [Bacteroidales bacterium]|nr:cytidylate kinase-like family protein [Bacteroidales bacterium]
MDDKKIIINIGRSFGSGGKAVADILSRKLGIPVYDNAILEQAARDSGIATEFFRKKDEHKNKFLSAIMKFDTWHFNTDGGVLSGNGLFQFQCDAIRSIAEKGSAIFVGRCADYVLRDMDCCLDVFICAPKDVRAKRISERLGIDEDKALDMLLSKDKERSSYYGYYTFTKWGRASTYDLCLDSSILGIEGTANFIIEFARRRGLL